jgi:Zn-dependent protease
VDRPRLVAKAAYLDGVSIDPDREDWQTVERDYEPIHPGGGTDWRKRLSRLTGPIVAAIVAAAKFSFVILKFASIFIAVAGYALIWGWKFAIGFVLLILVHELGHFIEAKREGLKPKLPVFIPFLGAYVQYTRGHPWQTVRVAIAGPILGGAAAFACYLVAQSRSDPHNVWSALAYTGFFLNLINLIPIGILDGGAVWRSARFLRLGGGRNLAYASYALYFATAAMLILGMIAAHVPQNRL